MWLSMRLVSFNLDSVQSLLLEGLGWFEEYSKKGILIMKPLKTFKIINAHCFLKNNTMKKNQEEMLILYWAGLSNNTNKETIMYFLLNRPWTSLALGWILTSVDCEQSWTEYIWQWWIAFVVSCSSQRSQNPENILLSLL